MSHRDRARRARSVRSRARLTPAALGLTLAVVAAVALVAPGSGLARAAGGYTSGFYAGRTSQGRPITFVVAAGRVTELYTEVIDGCHPGSYGDYLTPHPARVGAGGDWSHRANEIPSQPTVYHGRVSGNRASGTIDDVVKNRRGRRCHGHVHFRASPHSPVRIGAASVGGRGTDVRLEVSMPPGSDGNELIPYTATGLLVYGSNTGCPASYATADALARSVNADGYTGFISDAYVTADYTTQPYQLAPHGYAHGIFTFHVATNTVLPTATGASPFSTLCVLLYSGRPASSGNLGLASVQGPLRPGPGIPDTQP